VFALQIADPQLHDSSRVSGRWRSWMNWRNQAS
jgi:hypothetical protein